MDELIVCVGCGEECGVIAESFDYAGTHCTGGNSGTHKTGRYISDCCLDDIEEGTNWITTLKEDR